MRKRRFPAPLLALAAVLAMLIAACAKKESAPQGSLHRWWAGLGPVLPHDSFPADCKLCHVGQTWDELKRNFKFNHEDETGVALEGAHAQAMCLRCHNDRGPVEVFQRKGCVGCHEDYHAGELGPNCTQCHTDDAGLFAKQVQYASSTHRLGGNFDRNRTSCATCHTHQGFMERVETGSSSTAATIEDPAPLNCRTCHQIHTTYTATDYALTAGVFSRSPGNLNRARRELVAGNLYLNREITGALVERQPFGGFRMSGIGSKAGGPDYLLQFLIPINVTENTMRRGFAPPPDPEG